MGCPDAFSLVGCFVKKTLGQSGPLGRETLPTVLQVRVVRYLGVIFTPSEPPTTGTVSSTRGRPCRSLRRGLNAEARPPPPVTMAMFPPSLECGDMRQSFGFLKRFLTDCKSSKSTQDCAWESGRLQHMIQWIPAKRGTWQRPKIHMRLPEGSLMR